MCGFIELPFNKRTLTTQNNNIFTGVKYVWRIQHEEECVPIKKGKNGENILLKYFLIQYLNLCVFDIQIQIAPCKKMFSQENCFRTYLIHLRKNKKMDMIMQECYIL